MLTAPLGSVFGRSKTLCTVGAAVSGLLLTAGVRLRAEDAADWKRQLDRLTQQNALLQQQVQQQQKTIDVLSNRVSAV